VRKIMTWFGSMVRRWGEAGCDLGKKKSLAGGRGRGGGDHLEYPLLISAEFPFKESAGVCEGDVVVEIEHAVTVGKHDVPGRK
jgi:hypothetical protein